MARPALSHQKVIDALTAADGGPLTVEQLSQATRYSVVQVRRAVRALAEDGRVCRGETQRRHTMGRGQMRYGLCTHSEPAQAPEVVSA